MLVCLQLDQEIEKRTRTLRELQKDQEKSQRDFLYSSVNQSTNTSRIHIDLKLEIVEVFVDWFTEEYKKSLCDFS